MGSCLKKMASQRLIGISKKAVIFDSLCKVQKRGTAAVASSLKFDDFKSVYQFKSTKELMRSYSILRLCGINFFVDNSLKWMQYGQRLLGNNLFSKLSRPFFYAQFVGGDTEKELAHTAKVLLDSKVRLMVCPVQEEDIDDGSENDWRKYDENLEYIKNTAAIMSRCSTPEPNLQLKITAFMPATLVTKMTSIVQTQPHLKEQIVRHIGLGFGGEMMENEFKNDMGLNPEEVQDLVQGIARIKNLSDFSIENGLRLLVDAEYTYMNDGISLMALGMMYHYNKSKAYVGNTYQCYLKATYDLISEDYELITKDSNAKFGAKIVRGAYMEKEKKLANLHNYPDPINDSYEATGEMYLKVISYLLTKPDIYAVAATHNEKAVGEIVDMLKKKTENNTIVFGQIYGMGEQITMPLANDGFTVYKSVPYGPLDEVLPYLSRRVTENRAVLAGARKERDLLASELSRRILKRN